MYSYLYNRSQWKCIIIKNRSYAVNTFSYDGNILYFYLEHFSVCPYSVYMHFMCYDIDNRISFKYCNILLQLSCRLSNVSVNFL